MKKIYFLIFLANLVYANAISQKEFQEKLDECKEKSISASCFFVGVQVLFPTLSEKITHSRLDFKPEISTKDGLALLEKACFYDKEQKSLAVKEKKSYKNQINADAIACYSLFAMYENFSNSSDYHKIYIKAMQPYFKKYDGIDFYDEVHLNSFVRKDTAKALKYYKQLCYEQDLQLHCAKYKGLERKLKKLCSKGNKYACIN